jgi:nicotinate phosphoribosyltransferase
MIIKSLLENDVYKWNMSYAIMKTYPFAETVFKFKDRKNETFDQDFVDQFNLEVESLCALRLKPEEKKFLVSKFYWIPKYFFDWYENFKFDSSNLKVWLDEDKHFCVESRGLAYENEFGRCHCLLYLVSFVLGIVDLIRNSTGQRHLKY